MDTKYTHICPVKRNNIKDIEWTGWHDHVEREDVATLSLLLCTAMARAASEVAATHACTHTRVSAAGHAAQRNAAQRSAAHTTPVRPESKHYLSKSTRRDEIRAGSHGHVHAPAGTRAESPRRSSDSRWVLWCGRRSAAFSPSRIPLYTFLALRFFSLLSLSLLATLT